MEGNEVGLTDAAIRFTQGVGDGEGKESCDDVRGPTGCCDKGF